MAEASAARALGNFPVFAGSFRPWLLSATAARTGGAFAIAGALIALMAISHNSTLRSGAALDSIHPSLPAAAPVTSRIASVRAGVPLEVAKVFAEEEELLRRTTTRPVHPAPVLGWSPTGGLDLLVAKQIMAPAQPPVTEPAATTRTAADDVRLPSRKPAGRDQAPAPQVAATAPAQGGNNGANAESPPAAGGEFSFFAKLFGFADRAPTTLLASNPQTAVYDIKHHVVYLPNGERLEAHSGLGKWLDDPSSVDRKSRGVTPPNVYSLSLRTPLFHGVQAIRLTPVGDGNMFGRDGMLAHTYMLGPNGQSNGCVSFKDYRRFLQAFLNGEVKRLIVMPDLQAHPPQIAKSEPGPA